MHIDHLRYFIALCDFHSVTKASIFLNTTPQNVSRIVKNIEKKLDVILFTRSSEGIILTSYGEQFLQFAKTTVYNYDELQANFELQKNNYSNEMPITIYSNNLINESLLNDILTAFLKKYPSIIVNNITVDLKEGYQNLIHNPSSIALLYHFPQQQLPEELLSVPIFQIRPMAIMNKSHPLAKKQDCTKQQVLSYKLIIHSKNNVLDTAAFYALNLEPTIIEHAIACSGNQNACLQLVTNSDYITLGTTESFAHFSDTVKNQLTALPISDQPSLDCVLIKPKTLSADSPQQLLFSFILNYIQEHSLNAPNEQR